VSRRLHRIRALEAKRPHGKPVIGVIDLVRGRSFDDLLLQRFPEGAPLGAHILVFDGPNSVGCWQAGSAEEAGALAHVRAFDPEWS